MGLHDRQPAQHQRARGLDPRQRVRGARRREPRQSPHQGRVAGLQVDAVQEFAPCGADGCQAGENDALVRRVSGTLTVACFLDKKGCPPGSKFRFRKRIGRYGFAFIPAASRATRSRCLHLHRPTRRADPKGAPVALRPRPAERAQRGPRPGRAGLRAGAGLRVLLGAPDRILGPDADLFGPC